MPTGKKFKGDDRRKLLKLKKTINAIIARDLVAVNPKATAKVSTRVQVYTRALADPPPVALTAITDRIDICLAMTY